MFSSKFQHLAEIEAMRVRRQPVVDVRASLPAGKASEQQIRLEMERRCLEYLAKRKPGRPSAA